MGKYSTYVGGDKYKHRIEGWWRAGEARVEIENRTGITVPRWKWGYWLREGLIPRGQGRLKSGTMMLWSDLQLESIIVDLQLGNLH